MTASEIVLILVSGLGVIHGWSLALFLWLNKKGNIAANRWLSALLLVLSLRVGKSIFLAFADHLDVKIVFTGLSLMLLLGPIFYFFTHRIAHRELHLRSAQLLHFIPAIIGFGIGLWLNDTLVESLPKVFFIILFLTYYGHFLVYLLISRQVWYRTEAATQYQLWPWLFYGLLIVWFAYVLNLFDEVIPYVLGPILYTIIAYAITFIIIKCKYWTDIPKKKYGSNTMSDDQLESILEKAKARLMEQKFFTNSDLNLRHLSTLLKISPQTLSLAINKKTGQNFNHFVNSLRIDEAKTPISK